MFVEHCRHLASDGASPAPPPGQGHAYKPPAAPQQIPSANAIAQAPTRHVQVTVPPGVAPGASFIVQVRNTP